MAALGESADEPPRMAVDVALKVGQRFVGAFGLGLALNRKIAKDRNRERLRAARGVTHRAAVLVLGAIPAIVLPIFDAPVVAGQFQQALRAASWGP